MRLIDTIIAYLMGSIYRLHLDTRRENEYISDTHLEHVTWLYRLLFTVNAREMYREESLFRNICQKDLHRISKKGDTNHHEERERLMVVEWKSFPYMLDVRIIYHTHSTRKYLQHLSPIFIYPRAKMSGNPIIFKFSPQLPHNRLN